MEANARLLRLDEYARAQHFLDAHWARGHIYTRSKPLFDWSFHHPGFSNENYCFAVSEVNGEIIGILGVIPFLINDHGVRSRGGFLANWMMHPDFRHGGKGLHLLNLFKELGFETIIAFGIAKDARPLYQAMRWGYTSGTPRRFLIFPGGLDNFGEVMKIAQPGWEESRVRALGEAFSTSKSLPRTAEKSALDWTRWDEFLMCKHAPRMVGILRDANFLKWRYLNHPIFQYNIRISANDPGLLVWRLETIQRATAEGRAPVAKIARLLEFLPSSPENAEEMFGNFQIEAQAAGALGVDYYGYHGPTGVDLERVGMNLVENHPDGDLVPSRFQPLDGRGGNLVSAVLHKGSSRSPTYPFSRECPWYWTKGDSDQDRPN